MCVSLCVCDLFLCMMCGVCICVVMFSSGVFDVTVFSGHIAIVWAFVCAMALWTFLFNMFVKSC